MIRTLSKVRDTGFRFVAFSKRQKQVLTWWTDSSPYKDHNGIIADGSIRAGKTLTMAISFVISLVGWFLVKEKHVVEQDPEDKVKFSDFFELMRTNKPMMLNFFKCIFTGFIWTFLFAAPVYYVKYAYAADLTTGEVNMEYFATLSMVISMMMMFPLILGTIVANPVLKLFKKNFLKMHIFDLAMQGAAGALMFVMQILLCLIDIEYRKLYLDQG